MNVSTLCLQLFSPFAPFALRRWAAGPITHPNPPSGFPWMFPIDSHSEQCKLTLTDT